jgi:uncharacterized protein YdeI (YjbR/CyaY-like superfamily)
VFNPRNNDTFVRQTPDVQSLLGESWFDLPTPGRQRSIVHHLNLAKTTATRVRRAAQLTQLLEAEAKGE